mmetsp:Transcript_21921/g.43521  ORF Transcript_21921/g.43521 Transcript_21921/m.43521 type:complete len:1087 (-) Transcript_21921:464-3724(-)|eukprot:CAMPEP_0175138510 /NCGR_PEP_ID=MMETSP0087-20121206/10394_1 /TAXON_ID=136419 /ORGANISM="Unknown Unknown, Strain D1" /LENGTH=1086 /DNA_ID=CAMNT_0016421431 /DNA_START=54 /DNA_END=3314 /DNA_ORIENTATION=+
MNAEQLRQMEVILSHALSPDNNIRAQAERVLHQHMQNNRELFVFGILKLMRSSDQTQVRALSAIILRRKLPVGEPVLFDKLSAQLRKTILDELLQAVCQEGERYVRLQVCDTTAELAMVLLYKNGWPELVPFLFKCARSAVHELQLAAISIIGKLCAACPPEVVLQPCIADIYSVLHAALADTAALPLRICAVSALAKVVVNLEDTQSLERFQELIQPLFAVLSATLNEDAGNALGVLSEFADICSEKSLYFRPRLLQLVQTLAAVVNSAAAVDGARQLCLECLVLVCEESAGLLRKNEGALRIVVELAFRMLLDVEEDEEWSHNTDASSLEHSNFESGETALDRIAQAIQGAKMGPVVFPLISDFVSKNSEPGEWKWRHAGLRAMSQVGEVLPFERIPFPELLAFTADPHPRVRFAALQCVGQLCSDFEPELQDQYHAQVVPALLTSLQDSAHPRNQRHAAAALFNFIEPCSAEVLDPYVNTILTSLLAVLESSRNTVQEQVFTTIAAISGSHTEAFLPWYSKVAPLLKAVVTSATAPEQAELRGKAVDAISFIGLSIGAELFASDAKELMAMFVDMIHQNQFAADDVCEQYILFAFTRICEALGEDFLPFLPSVMPLVLHRAGKDEDWARLAKNDEDGSPASARLLSKGFTSALEEKTQACCILAGFCHDLGPAYYPYLPETVSILVPLMHFRFNDDLRTAAMTAAPDLVKCAVQAVGASAAPLHYLVDLFRNLLAELLKCCRTEVDLDILLVLVQTLQLCLDEMGDLAQECMDQTNVDVIGQSLLKLLKQSATRIRNREQKRSSPDYDVETADWLHRQNSSEDQLNVLVSECVASLMRTHGERFIPTFDTLCPEILRMLAGGSSQESIKVALYMFDDCVEYIGARASVYFPRFLPSLLPHLLSSNCDIRQGAAYGVTVCVEAAPTEFAPYAADAVRLLCMGLEAPESSMQEFAMATDNMATAVGRIAVLLDKPDLLPVWLSRLPIEHDESERTRNHEQLCSLVESGNNADVLGESYSNLPKILSVFSWVVDDANDSDGELVQRAVGIMSSMKRTLPAELLAQVVGACSARDQHKLGLIFSQIS